MKLFTTTATAILASTAVNAAGLDATPAQPVFVTSTAPLTWTGAYAGGSLGFGSAGATAELGTILAGFLGAPPANGDVSISDDGLSYGLHAGYNQQNGSLVYGVELAVFSNSAEVSVGNDRIDLDYAARLVGKLGYASGDVLVYGTGGFAHAQFSSSGPTVGNSDFSDNGYSVGFGVDYMLTNSVVLGGEYTYSRFNDFDDTAGVDAEISNFAVKLSYKF